MRIQLFGGFAFLGVATTMMTWQSTNALMNYQRLYSRSIRNSNSNSRTMTTSTTTTTVAQNSNPWTMRINPTSFDGTDMTITEYPMPVLRRQPNEPITTFDDKLRQTAKEMMTIMYQAKGVGLAAPQVNLGIQLFVYNPTGDPKETNFERIVCNPIIKEYSKETDIEEEGCLSSLSDDCAGCVCRACAIMVEYQNELGQKTIRRLKGFEARVFQHEYDHIQGILHFDRFSPEDREKNQAVLEKLVQKYGKDDAILEPDPLLLKSIQPPPLTAAGRMPPRVVQEEEDSVVEIPKMKLKPKAKTGFGGGGGGGGGGGAKAKNKKKK